MQFVLLRYVEKNVFARVVVEFQNASKTITVEF